jgi:hypothetical protein
MISTLNSVHKIDYVNIGLLNLVMHLGLYHAFRIVFICLWRAGPFTLFD